MVSSTPYHLQPVTIKDKTVPASDNVPPPRNNADNRKEVSQATDEPILQRHRDQAHNLVLPTIC